MPGISGLHIIGTLRRARTYTSNAQEPMVGIAVRVDTPEFRGDVECSVPADSIEPDLKSLRAGEAVVVGCTASSGRTGPYIRGDSAKVLKAEDAVTLAILGLLPSAE